MVSAINRNRERLNTPGSAPFQLYHASEQEANEMTFGDIHEMAHHYFKQLNEQFLNIEGNEQWTDGYRVIYVYITTWIEP